MKIRRTCRKLTRRPYHAHLFDQTKPLVYYEGMGKVAKTPKKAGALNPGNVPNRETREAMASLERGEGEICADAADLLKKLKS